MTAVIDALEAECAAFITAIRTLDASEWSRTSNCPPWNVKELVAHNYGSTMVDPSRLQPPVDGAPIVEAADYYRRAERDTTAYRTGNVDRSQRFAATFASDEAILRACERDWPRMIERLRAETPSRLIGMSWGVSMTLDDYLVSRVIGVAAHGVDVAITLDRQTWTTSAALRIARPTLESLLGAELPKDLSWTDQDLLETGTGRRGLDDAERSILGPLADRFPLLS